MDIEPSAGTGSNSAVEKNITAQELIDGYVFHGPAGDGVALTFPGAVVVQTALAKMNITSSAGMKLHPVIVNVTDTNDLIITAGPGETVVTVTNRVINSETVLCYYVFTGADTALIFIIRKKT